MLKLAPKVLPDSDADARRRRLAEAVAMQEIEGNPLTTDEIAMFEMFEREGWSHEQRRAHILERHRQPD